MQKRGASARHKIPSSRFNWLKDLDYRAKKFPQFDNWTPFLGLFLLVRYPRLRPRCNPKKYLHPKLYKSSFESDRKHFWELIDDYIGRIKEKAEVRVVLQGLDHNLQKQLAALLLDSIVALEEHRKNSFYKKLHRELLERGETWQKKLNARANDIRKAALALREEALTLSRHLSHNKRRYLRFISNDSQIADKIIEILNERATSFHPHAETLEAIAQECSSPNPSETFMVRFYWFFRHGCRKSGQDSEVHVAKIRNAFWTDFGIRSVKFRPEYDHIESSGCDAVRKAVSRYKPQN